MGNDKNPKPCTTWSRKQSHRTHNPTWITGVNQWQEPKTMHHLKSQTQPPDTQLDPNRQCLQATNGHKNWKKSCKTPPDKFKKTSSSSRNARNVCIGRVPSSRTAPTRNFDGGMSVLIRYWRNRSDAGMRVTHWSHGQGWRCLRAPRDDPRGGSVSSFLRRNVSSHDSGWTDVGLTNALGPHNSPVQVAPEDLAPCWTRSQESWSTLSLSRSGASPILSIVVLFPVFLAIRIITLLSSLGTPVPPRVSSPIRMWTTSTSSSRIRSKWCRSWPLPTVSSISSCCEYIWSVADVCRCGPSEIGAGYTAELATACHVAWPIFLGFFLFLFVDGLSGATAFGQRRARNYASSALIRCLSVLNLIRASCSSVRWAANEWNPLVGPCCGQGIPRKFLRPCHLSCCYQWHHHHRLQHAWSYTAIWWCYFNSTFFSVIISFKFVFGNYARIASEQVFKPAETNFRRTVARETLWEVPRSYRSREPAWPTSRRRSLCPDARQRARGASSTLSCPVNLRLHITERSLPWWVRRGGPKQSLLHRSRTGWGTIGTLWVKS